MQDEGPSRGHDTDFILIDEDLSSPSSKLRETIQEQKAEIDTLTIKLQRAQWIINYLEQQNKQLEYQQTIMELQNIRENRQAAQRSQIEMTPIEREIEADRETWLERVNIHLEKLLEKEKKENNMLRHMKNHYWARNHVCKARIKILKARLRRALQCRKRHDRLQILAEASLA